MHSPREVTHLLCEAGRGARRRSGIRCLCSTFLVEVLIGLRCCVLRVCLCLCEGVTWSEIREVGTGVAVALFLREEGN